MRNLRRLAAILLVTPLVMVGAATTANADPSIDIAYDSTDVGRRRTHHAEFAGKMASTKRSGDTSQGHCYEVVTFGPVAGTFGCYVTWAFKSGVRGNICTTDADSAKVAEADYFSGTASLTIGSVQLSGVGEAGSAILTGTAITVDAAGERHVFRITINAADACGTTTLLADAGVDTQWLTANPPLEFSGTADYT